MARQTAFERADTQDSVGASLVVAICVVLLVGIVALFTVFGGPGRFIAGPTPPVIDANPPAQSQPQSAAQPGLPR